MLARKSKGMKMKSYWIASSLTLVCSILTSYLKLTFLASFIISLILVPGFITIVREKQRKNGTPSLKDDIAIWLALLLFYVPSFSIAVQIQYGFNVLPCMFTECCTDSWIATNVTGNELFNLFGFLLTSEKKLS